MANIILPTAKYYVDGITWKPGVSSKGNHVETFAELVAAISGMDTFPRVTLDTTHGNCVILSSDAFDLQGKSIELFGNGIIEIEDGASAFMNFGSMYVHTGVNIMAHPSAWSPMQSNNGGFALLFVDQGGSISFNGAASVPIVQLKAVGINILETFLNGQLDNSASPSQSLIGVDDNCSVQFFSLETFIGDPSPELISGGGSTVLIAGRDAFGPVVPQNQQTGTFVPTRLQKSEHLDWSTGNTASRPANPIPGQPYFNTQRNVYEYFDGSVWSDFNAFADASYLRGWAIDATPPAAGQALVFNGASYVPTNVGGGGSGWNSAANAAAATALDDSSWDNGTPVWIDSFDCLWVFNSTDTSTPVDGVTVIASASGFRIFRTNVTSPRWVRQLTWHIDEVLGNDENLGMTAGAGNALETLAEFFRRIGGTQVATTIKVYLDTSLTPIVDIPKVNFKSLGAFTFVLIEFHGTPTVVRTGTVTAYNALSGASNSLPDLDDSGATATDRNRRVYNTTAGPRLGSSAWYGKNPNGVQGWTSGARITSDWGKSDYTSIFGTTTATPPLIGDTFEVQTVPGIAIGSVDGIGGLGNGYVFNQLHVSGGTLGMNLQHSEGMICYFYNCDVDTSQNNCFAPTSFIGCSIRQGGIYVRSIVEMYSGIFSTSSASATTPSDGPYSYPGGYFTAFNNVCSDQARGATSQPGGWQRLNGYLTFNTGSSVASNVWGSGINVNGVTELRATAGSSKIIGKFATRTGISIVGGGKLTCSDWGNVTITGGNNITDRDFEIDKKKDLRAFDETTGTFTSVRDALWSNMTQAVSSGGFGGYAVDPPSMTSTSTAPSYP